jgi:hypothetical protein
MGIVVGAILLLYIENFVNLPQVVVSDTFVFHHSYTGMIIVAVSGGLYFVKRLQPFRVILLFALGFGSILVIDELPNLVTNDWNAPSIFLSSR